MLLPDVRRLELMDACGHAGAEPRHVELGWPRRDSTSGKTVAWKWAIVGGRGSHGADRGRSVLLPIGAKLVEVGLHVREDAGLEVGHHKGAEVAMGLARAGACHSQSKLSLSRCQTWERSFVLELDPSEHHWAGVEHQVATQ